MTIIAAVYLGLMLINVVLPTGLASAAGLLQPRLDHAAGDVRDRASSARCTSSSRGPTAASARTCTTSSSRAGPSGTPDRRPAVSGRRAAARRRRAVMRQPAGPAVLRRCGQPGGVERRLRRAGDPRHTGCRFRCRTARVRGRGTTRSATSTAPARCAGRPATGPWSRTATSAASMPAGQEIWLRPSVLVSVGGWTAGRRRPSSRPRSPSRAGVLGSAGRGSGRRRSLACETSPNQPHSPDHSGDVVGRLPSAARSS